MSFGKSANAAGTFDDPIQFFIPSFIQVNAPALA